MSNPESRFKAHPSAQVVPAEADHKFAPQATTPPEIPATDQIAPTFSEQDVTPSQPHDAPFKRPTEAERDAENPGKFIDQAEGGEYL